MCFSCCVLHSALGCCSATFWHLSMPAALVLHNNQIPNYCNWCCDAIYTCCLARNSEAPLFPRSVPGDSGLESPSPQYLLFASVPFSPCRWANTWFVECERQVGPRLKGSCSGFRWPGGEWCQFVWHCVWYSQLHVSLLSGFYVHAQCCFNLGFVFS